MSYHNANYETITSGDYMCLEKRIQDTVHLVEQRICAASEDYGHNEISISSRTQRKALYGCVHHQTNHVYVSEHVARNIIDKSFGDLTKAIKLSRTQNLITLTEKKNLNRTLLRSQGNVLNLHSAAKLNQSMINVILSDERSKEESRQIAERKKQHPNGKGPMTSARKSKRRAYQDKAGLLPSDLLIPASEVSVQDVKEYYRCFRKQIHVFEEKADHAVMKNHGNKVENMSAYLCEFCTGYHIGHHSKSDQKDADLIKNARRHWHRNPSISNDFVRTVMKIRDAGY